MSAPAIASLYTSVLPPTPPRCLFLFSQCISSISRQDSRNMTDLLLEVSLDLVYTLSTVLESIVKSCVVTAQ